MALATHRRLLLLQFALRSHAQSAHTLLSRAREFTASSYHPQGAVLPTPLLQSNVLGGSAGTQSHTQSTQAASAEQQQRMNNAQTHARLQVHWANVLVGASTLPFVYTPDPGNTGYRVDAIKHALLERIRYLDRHNITNQTSTEDPTHTHTVTAEMLRLSPDDIFIPSENGSLQFYGYVMFPSVPGRTDPSKVTSSSYFFCFYYHFLFLSLALGYLASTYRLPWLI